jgi:hypothetical protein
MKTHVFSRARFFFMIIPLVLICVFSGCKRSDIVVVTKGNLPGRLETIGKVFDTCPLFTQVRWDRIKEENGRKVVVFIAEVSAPDLLRKVSEDAQNWLGMERRYFDSVSADVEKALIKITFPVKRPSFYLQDIMLGLSSSAKTAWSPALSDAEKERVVDTIYEKNDLLFTLLAPYANPSVKNGTTLFYELTGKRITDFD